MQARIFSTALLASLLCACAVERVIRIDTDPPGALVLLDREVVGRTPLEVPFTHYGVRRLSFSLDGYRPTSSMVRFEPPWYGDFPYDLVTETLWPFGWRDEHEVSIVLARESGQVTEPDLAEVLARAEALRKADMRGPRPVFQEEVEETGAEAEGEEEGAAPLYELEEHP